MKFKYRIALKMGKGCKHPYLYWSLYGWVFPGNRDIKEWELYSFALQQMKKIEKGSANVIARNMKIETII